MIVYKFGGASVQSADAVKNIANIISTIDNKIVVVVSAMGKITNKLELLIDSYFNKKDDIPQNLETIKSFHLEIISQLFEENHPIFAKFEQLIADLSKKLNSKVSDNFDFEYDKIIVFGELLSTTIISEYLKSKNIQNQFIDIRKSIITDGYNRDGRVIWDETEVQIKQNFKFEENKIFITQGYIASDRKGNSVTLGREGSDFSASIIAFCLNAESVTIWKDVPGILNADPRIFEDTFKIDRLTYKETVELAYYGAQVIHPKTIKPLENKKIPLFVKSFIEPNKNGSIISNFNAEEAIIHKPIIIIKDNQALISISPRDFSFIEEGNISKIFTLLESLKIKVNLMENSAVSFSIIIDNTNKIKEFLNQLKTDFKIKYNTNLKLVTIRHYNQNVLNELLENKEIIVEQKTRNTARYAIKDI